MTEMKPKDFNTIKQWLFPLLEAKQMSVEQLARQSKITRTALYYYLSDKRRPTPDTMRRMCDVLSVSHEEGLAQFTERQNGRPRERDDAGKKRAKH